MLTKIIIVNLTCKTKNWKEGSDVIIAFFSKNIINNSIFKQY